jgi:hypothetical protein
MHIKNLYWLSFLIMGCTALVWQFAIGIGQDSMHDSLRPKGPEDAVGIVSWGEPVRFEDYLVEDRWSLFAAVSRNSASSMETMHWLEPACKESRVLLRKIALKTIACEVVKQHKIERPLPQFWLYEGKRLVSTDREEVQKLISEMKSD